MIDNYSREAIATPKWVNPGMTGCACARGATSKMAMRATAADGRARLCIAQSQKAPLADPGQASSRG